MEPATPARVSKSNKRSRSLSTSTPRSIKVCNSSGGKTSDSRKPNNSSATDSSVSIGGKSNKGLRHFSKHVCNKLEEKQRTSYNEVADELVAEFLAERTAEDEASRDGADLEVDSVGTAGKKKRGAAGHDEKNIRRRVYDALNVLDALNIISKEKKEIRWKGLPSRTSSDLKRLQNERDECMAGVKKKRELLQDLIVQRVCFGNLAKRNASDKEQQQMSRNPPQDDDKIPLPFIVVNASSRAVIQVDINEDQTEVMFDFNMPFEMSDDNAILKRLGFNKTTDEELSKMLPPELLRYCKSKKLLDPIIAPPSEPLPSSSSYQDNTYPTQEYHPRHQDQEQEQEQEQRFPSYPVHNHSQPAAYSVPPQHHLNYHGGAPHHPSHLQQPQQHSFDGYAVDDTAPSSFLPPPSY